MVTNSVNSGATLAFGNLKRISYAIGFLMVLLGSACLIFDLGRPELFYLLFTRANSSILSIGTFILTATLVLALFLVLSNFLFLNMPSIVKKIAELFCSVSALCLIAYVGVFLQRMGTVPFWSSFAIPVVFILSSLSIGMALLFLIIPFVQGGEWLTEHVGKINIGHRIILILEIVALTVLLWQSSLHWTTARSLELLLGPDLMLWFLVGAVGLGILIPLLLELYYAFIKRSPLLPLYCILCLIGGFCLRYCIVLAGIY